MKSIKKLAIFLSISIAVFYISLNLYSNQFIAQFENQDFNNYLLESKRLYDTPIISKFSDSNLIKDEKKHGFISLASPTVVRVPKWIKKPLGKYYLYFSHHKGEYIKMAYSDSINGRWTIYNDTILSPKNSTLITYRTTQSNLKDVFNHNNSTETFALLSQLDFKNNNTSVDSNDPHIASPEIIINNESKEIVIFFHGMVSGNIQKCKIAISKDGLNFNAKSKILTGPYLKLVEYKNSYLGISMSGVFYKFSKNLKNMKMELMLLIKLHLNVVFLLSIFQ